MVDLTALRKDSMSDFTKISGEFDKIANPQSSQKQGPDERFWKLDPDKAGNATAVIRFLPRVEGDELPWVRVFSHGFQGPTGKWYIENSLTTLGEKDPVGELNSKLWNSGSEANKDIARKQKRRLSYIVNVLIVSDPKHPENEGQVRLYKFGKKIFDKIMEKARPTFDDEKPVNVFDLWTGADFRLRMKKVAGFPNYDESQFSEVKAVPGADEELVSIVEKQHKLSEFVAPDQFKSYEALSKRLMEVLEDENAGLGTAENAVLETVAEAPKPKSAPAPEPVAKAEPTPPSGEQEEDVMSYFQKIADSE